MASPSPPPKLSPVLPTRPAREAWGDGDPDGDVELCGAGSQEHCERKTGWRKWTWLAADVTATFLLVVALFWSPICLAFLVLAMLWKGELNLVVHTFFFMLVLLVMCCPPCTICCHRKRGASFSGLRWLQRRKYIIAAALMIGSLSFVIFAACLFHTDMTTPDLKLEYDASVPVAVVGSGPSGLSAAWMLAKGGRQVTIFESLGEIGGHSKSWVEESNGRNLTIDLGFIFNNAASDAYVSYKHIAGHFNRPLRSSALNTSGYFHGEYWDNTGNPERFDAPLKEEINRFMQLANTPATTMRYLTPLGFWLWYHGFSERFRRVCLDSTMSVLFVTKMGLAKQSAQGVLNYFRLDEGFTHLRYDIPKVEFNPGGSQNMWKDVVADMVSTGRVQVRLNSRVASVDKADGRWTLTLADGSQHGGFGDVVMACPADVSAKVISGRPLESVLVSQIQYIDAQVTLHTDAAATISNGFEQSTDDVLYFVSHDHMTGKIGKIFEDPSSNLLLSVHGQEHQALSIDPAKTKWSTVWSHHYFSLFELVIARKFVPMFNHGGGLHYSGDWVYGVGHNDAIKSGVHAACAVGIPRTPPDSSSDPLYSRLLERTCRL